MKTTIYIKRFISILALPSVGSAALICKPEGPVLPKPILSSLGSSSIVSDAADNLAATLDDAMAGVVNAGWDTKNASFSLALVSADQSEPGIPLWEYHHLAEANSKGTEDIDRNSQYLIGSISKLISDYVLLQTGINLDVPVTDYLPKLAEPGSRIQWEEVTLRALATHLAGAPVNYGFSEYYYLKETFLSYGLPPLQSFAYPPCGVIALNGECSQEQFLDGMQNSYPLAAVNQRPAYSNTAFAIMFMAIENVTGKSFTQLIHEHFSQPLGLQNTMPSPGDEKKAVVPPGQNSWGSDYGYNAPAGGLVSSLSDLTKFAHGILSRSIPMSEANIHNWLKPTSFAGSPYNFVGLPWEIYRPTNLTPDHPHSISVHGKGGSAMAYRSQFNLVDEYGIGIVILTAGPAEILPLLNGAMMTTFVVAADKASRAQAEDAYARTFMSAHSNCTIVTATFTQDKDSLVLTELTRGGFDLLAGLLNIWGLTVGQLGLPLSAPIRLFPDDLAENTTLDDGTSCTKEVWRLWPQLNSATNSELPGVGYQADDCLMWTLGDWVHYGSEPIDRVIFYRDHEGDVFAFEAPFLRSGLLLPA